MFKSVRLRRDAGDLGFSRVSSDIRRLVARVFEINTKVSAAFFGTDRKAEIEAVASLLLHVFSNKVK
jgi:hypothetical protein